MSPRNPTTTGSTPTTALSAGRALGVEWREIPDGKVYKHKGSGVLWRLIARGKQHDIYKLRRLIGRKETATVTGPNLDTRFEEMPSDAS